jgi:hypothetical protein
VILLWLGVGAFSAPAATLPTGLYFTTTSGDILVSDLGGNYPVAALTGVGANGDMEIDPIARNAYYTAGGAIHQATVFGLYYALYPGTQAFIHGANLNGSNNELLSPVSSSLPGLVLGPGRLHVLIPEVIR